MSAVEVPRSSWRCSVPLARLAPPLSLKRPHVFLLVCVLTSLLLPNGAAAQSGRRTVKKVSPVPAEATPGAQPNKSEARITSVIICGHDIGKEVKEDYSTSVSTLVKSFTAGMNERPVLLGVVNGGKMKREEAVERAKREQGAYVLWFGYSLKMVGWYYTSVEYIDYTVYKPQTAEVLVEGRVYPDEQKTHADPGGIMRLPTSRRRSRVPDTHRQLETGGREIANRVRNKL